MAEETTEEVKETPEAPKETKGGQTGMGLDQNVAALLAYLFGWVSGLIFFLIEKENKFVRFAAMQSILLSVIGMAGWWILGILLGILTVATGTVGLLFSLVLPLLGLGYLIVWIMLMVKAYQNEEWELPVIGKIARNVVSK